MSNEISGGTRVTVHFHGGTTATTTLSDQDVVEIAADFSVREDVDSIIEYVLTRPGKPRFQWLGDIFLHPQAVTGVELLDLTI